MKDWIIPPDYDHVEAEARHLVREADTDGVRKLCVHSASRPAGLNLLCKPGASWKCVVPENIHTLAMIGHWKF